MSDMLNVASKAIISSSSNKKQLYEEGILTEVEENPWCSIDLGRNFPCSSIKIYNLKTIDNVKVEVSSDLNEWQELSISSQNDSELHLQILPQFQIRYIRVSRIGYVSLEFSKIEAYVTDLIVSARDDALGSRMYALINGMIIAKKIGFNFGYVWKDIWLDWQNGDDNAAGMEIDPENLVFDEKFIMLYSYSNYLCNNTTLVVKKKKLQNLKELPYDYPWGYYAPLGYSFDDYSDENYRKDFKECFFEIHFHKNIQIMFDEVEKLTLKLGQFVSFHLRGIETIHGSGSKTLQKACYYKVFPYEIALEGIKQELKSNKKILLFGDDLKLLAEIKKYFQNDSIIIVDDLIDRKKNTPTQNAFFEIYLMSKSQKIYRAGSSLFSRFAHAISNAKMVNIFTDYSKQERFDWILKNVDILSLEPFHRKAYSYFCLYLLSKELKLPLEQSLKYINLAIENYPDNYLFYSLYLIDCYIEKNDLEKIEELVRKSLLLDKNTFFKSLFMNFAGLVNGKEMDNIILLSNNVNLERFPYFSY
ncbi:capsular biosynthesis protein, partial [Campylobacter coli]|nr:capsular biosynthesis protein [Campylobacter coli]